MAEADLVIRDGTLYDGTGAAPRTADVAVAGGKIIEVGKVAASGAREIEADGLMVTPGFVDIHTHYDGQATWDSRLTPSSWHGVTTVVMGNCGVGFAPVRPDQHDLLIELMEGVEDIPGTALHEGLSWNWQSFPEYMDALEAVPHDMDFCAQIPHGALRVFVMGERGANREPATPDDIDAMRKLVAEGIRAGAIGFTTSRTLNHRTSKGEPTPSLTASKDELLGLAQGLADAEAGVFEMISDFKVMDEEFATFREMVERSRRPMTISLGQVARAPDSWRRLLQRIEQASDDGVKIKGQVASRAIGTLLGLQASHNPFTGLPSMEKIGDLPLEQKVATLRDPAFRQRLFSEEALPGFHDAARRVQDYQRMYEFGDPPDYEPGPEKSVAAIAAREGREPRDVAYDYMLKDDGRAFLYSPHINYADGNLGAVREMMLHKDTVMGLGDGGAHVGIICDASFAPFLLTHWGRDRKEGRLPLEWLIKSQTADTARTVGLYDRGVIAPGMKADINVIDFDNLRLDRPQMAYDLPAGGKRLLQRSYGIEATIVSGEVTYEKGEPTDALPGRLVRGAQAAPK